MKYLYNRKGLRRGEAERHQFAFFTAGACVVLAIVFVVGIQVGRVIERRSAAGAAKKAPAGPIVERQGVQPAADAAKDMGSYAKDAAGIASAGPAGVREQVEETEKGLTFRRTLSAVAPQTVPLAAALKQGGEGAKAKGAARAKYFVQAGAFRERAGAAALAERLEKNGFQVKVVEAAGGNGVFRVLLGPFPDRGEAREAVRELKQRAGIAGFLVNG